MGTIFILFSLFSKGEVIILCQSSFGMGGNFQVIILFFLFPHVAVVEDGEGI